MKKIVSFFVVAIMLISLVSAATITVRPDGQGKNKWKNKNCASGSSEWTCVDEDPASTSDYLETRRTGREESFTFSSTGLSSETINSVTLYYYAKRKRSNDRCFSALVVSGGTSYTAGTQMCTGSSWAYESHTYTTNPATGSAWTVAGVNSLEAGMEATSPYSGGKVAQVYAVVDYTAGTPDSCSDTDGFDIENQGSVNGVNGGTPFSHTDSCASSMVVNEWYCAGTNPALAEIICIVGNQTNSTGICVNGACV